MVHQIKLVFEAHLVSLLPLRDNEKCKKLFKSDQIFTHYFCITICIDWFFFRGILFSIFNEPGMAYQGLSFQNALA